MQVQLLHGQASGHGADQATRFLDNGYLCRVLMLFPAAHTWFKLAQLSILVPVSVRVALVGMKAWVGHGDARCASTSLVLVSRIFV